MLPATYSRRAVSLLSGCYFNLFSSSRKVVTFSVDCPVQDYAMRIEILTGKRCGYSVTNRIGQYGFSLLGTQGGDVALTLFFE